VNVNDDVLFRPKRLLQCLAGLVCVGSYRILLRTGKNSVVVPVTVPPFTNSLWA
jgi:hypothetical protein